MIDVIDISEFKKKLKTFVKERKWHNFHNPKNLSMSLVREASELMEIFQWLTASESKKAHTNNVIKKNIEEELSDVLINVIRLADECNINILDSLTKKIHSIKTKYPVKLVKGKAKKYSEYLKNINNF